MQPYQWTPWARQQVSDELREIIETAQPTDHLVHLGRGESGWTCRILSPKKEGVAGEAYGEPTPMVAFMAAWSRVKA